MCPCINYQFLYVELWNLKENSKQLREILTKKINIVHLPGHLGIDLDMVEKSGIPLLSTQKQNPSWHCTFWKCPSASHFGTYWPRRRGLLWVAASMRLHKVSTDKYKHKSLTMSWQIQPTISETLDLIWLFLLIPNTNWSSVWWHIKTIFGVNQ